MSSLSKPPKASPKMLSYVFSLAEQYGVDAEALSSMHFSKDFADLSDVEADGLIETIKSNDANYNADEAHCCSYRLALV